jgi:hypothetical protein
MTEYERLCEAEKTCHTIEIREKATGKEGVAGTHPNGVAVFYGADDGSDDKVISPEEFSQDFEITYMISGRGEQ